MTETSILFSEFADDISLARSFSDFEIVFASEEKAFRTFFKKFSITHIFIRPQLLTERIKDFLKKDPCQLHVFSSSTQLKNLIGSCLAEKSFTDESKPFPNKEYSLLCKKSPVFASLVGKSPAMESLRHIIVKVAATDIPVLLLGESGCGKSIIAQAIHELSARRNANFKAVLLAKNNGSINDSEIFGVAANTFTGVEAKAGIFEYFNGGTVFLDEICDFPIYMQPKLLQVTDSRILSRMGSHEVIKIDVRLICATNKSIKKEMAEGNFREDLYNRINGITIKVPPLSERIEDIPDIARAYLKKINVNKEISPAAMASLQSLKWNGNIRSLERCLQAAALVHGINENVIQPWHIKLNY
ncbi:MAG: sigma 54-interacting transcriptional regulator [Treponema sp.]|nr:sigma 54-interacting transcriptional regulator [Treponema sp.]